MTTLIPGIDPTKLETPKQRIAYLRDFISKLPRERFDMSIYAGRDGLEDIDVELLADCGTVACLCGWTVALFQLDCLQDDDEIAGKALGLNYDDAWDLFVPANREQITNQQAAAVLDHLIKTGKVDWSVAREIG